MKKGLIKYIYIFIVVLAIILVFTFFDYLIHSLSESWSVPSYYFRNKIIFGTLIGFIAYLFLKEKSVFSKALVFSAIISLLLQIRYALAGFSLNFVVDFLFIHFFILLAVSFIAFKLFGKFI